MNRNFIKISLLVIIAISLSGCATIFGGKITDCQRTKPTQGQPSRKIRMVPLILDIIIWPSIIVDFSTKAIYKPCQTKGNVKPAEQGEKPPWQK